MTGYCGYRPLADFTKLHRESLIELLDLDDPIELPSYSTFQAKINMKYPTLNHLKWYIHLHLGICKVMLLGLYNW